jgi:UDP-N-acetylmuramoyl-tripeptide--D-alanyl-D-alanine ligase
MSLPIWQAAVLALVAGVAGYRQFQGWVYLFQLDEYLPSRLWSTAARRLGANWPWQLGLLVSGVALALVAAAVGPRLRPLPLLVACLLPLPFFRLFATRAVLKWTKRARRLAAIAALLVLLALLLGIWAGPVGAVLVGLLDLLLVLALALSAALSQPYEAVLRRRFMASAEARLAVSKPLVVGITGSYGKTTTKVILGQLLDTPEQPCFSTPESYNTTLGVCRALNEGLLPSHRLAVVEMGAYRPGEIAEICSFTHPTVAIVTAVGLMHLERFGSRVQIARAKSELLAALPADGFAVVPSDIAERETLLRNLRARLLSVGAPGDRWWVEQEELGPTGTALRLRGSAGEDVALQVPVYGHHLVLDLLCAIAVAAELGRPLGDIVARAATIEGAPHRLEVTRHAGITIIDDAYNANPTGAVEALRLLAALPGQRRVLVTPGYIELGSEQEQSMRELGRMAAGVCTHVILVGPRHSVPVALGLREAGYPDGQVSVVADLNGAQRILPEVAGSGSVVLFENDLPDQYLERS